MRNRRMLYMLLIAVLLVLAVTIAFTGGDEASNSGTHATPTITPKAANLPTKDNQQVPTPDIQAEIEVPPTQGASLAERANGQLCVQVIDVKHGDAILVVGPTGKTMLIDTGEGDQRKALRKALDQAGIERIDVLQLTHPHSDHIGNAPWVLNNYPVGEVHMLDKAHTTRMYDDLLDALEEVSVPVKKIEPGFSFDFDGARCEYIGPQKLTYRGMNDCSAVMKMTYGEKSFLFTGDMEVTAERDLASAQGEAIDVDFLKVGHHATNSTEDPFAEATSPEVSVISSKPLKSYTNPERKQAVVDRLANQGSQVYVTGSFGTVTTYCDGKSFKVTYSHEPDNVDMEMTIPTPSPAIPIETIPLSKNPATPVFFVAGA